MLSEKALFNKENKINIKLSAYKLYKRLFDIISSFAGLIILSPVFVIIYILIKSDSEGPVLFPHNRLGQYGKIIKVYKFRTMCVNAEEILEKLPEHKLKEFRENFKFDDDPRVTRLGRILRETSLDELPQLFNILIGNMSTVGPRPIVAKELQKYGDKAEKLLSVKPGLTGFWQVNGRSNTSYEERVNMDMYYIDNRSAKLDLSIVFKTVITVLKKDGAR